MTFDSRNEISLYNSNFDVVRNELDARLREVVADMVAKGLNAGSITLKIDVTTKKTLTADMDAPMGMRPAMRLEIEADVSSVIQSREKTKCAVIAAGDRELVMDEHGRMFAVTPEEASGQLSMFNSWDEYAEAAVRE